MKYILKLNVSAVRIPLLNLPTFWGDRPTGGKGLALPGSSGPNLPWEVWNFHGPRCEVSWEKNTSPKLIWYPWSLTLQLANRERVGIFQPPLFFFFRGRSCQTWEEYSPKNGTNEKKGRLMTFFSTKCTILSGTRWVIERTCAIETGKKPHRSKFEINMHKFQKANYFSNGEKTHRLYSLSKNLGHKNH